jgi:hypothetical protein
MLGDKIERHTRNAEGNYRVHGITLCLGRGNAENYGEQQKIERPQNDFCFLIAAIVESDRMNLAVS